MKVKNNSLLTSQNPDMGSTIIWIIILSVNLEGKKKVDLKNLQTILNAISSLTFFALWKVKKVSVLLYETMKIDSSKDSNTMDLNSFDQKGSIIVAIFGAFCQWNCRVNASCLDQQLFSFTNFVSLSFLLTTEGII